MHIYIYVYICKETNKYLDMCIYIYLNIHPYNIYIYSYQWCQRWLKCASDQCGRQLSDDSSKRHFRNLWKWWANRYSLAARHEPKHVVFWINNASAIIFFINLPGLDMSLSDSNLIFLLRKEQQITMNSSPRPNVQAVFKTAALLNHSN